MVPNLMRGLVRALPTALAVRLVVALANKMQRPPVRPPEQALLDEATRVPYGADFSNVAWSWGSGPLVLLVHGWNGRAAQLAPLAKAIADAGFRAVAIEVTGHGASPGRSTAWRFFIRDVAALAEALQSPVHALVGHSAGALTMMAARRVKGLQAQRYVCIAGPSFPFPPLEAVRQRLDPPEGVLDGYREHLARSFSTSWAALEAGSSFEGAGEGLLLVYDEGDRYVPHSQGDRILSLCPGARLVKTTGHSHTRILQAPELAREVVAALN